MPEIVEMGWSFEEEVDGARILKLLERAGRTCYKSEGKISEISAPEFIARRLNPENPHESVIEHEKVTIRVVCDRGVSHEIVRHRLGSYSQESTRYCNYNSKNGGVIQVIRPTADMSREAFDIWYHCMEICELTYNSLVAIGVSPQIARDALPHALKTELVVTYNLREWRHFFKLRTSPTAHPAMRKLALSILAGFKEKIPVIFDDFSNC